MAPRFSASRRPCAVRRTISPPAAGDPFGLRDRSGGVVRVGIGHRLDTDRVVASDSGVSYLNGNGFPPAVPGQRIAKFLHVAFKFFAKLRNSAADSVSLIQIRDGRWVIFSTTTSSFSPEWGSGAPAAAKGARYPHARRPALLLSVPLHRPQPHLAHRRDRRRFADLYPTPGTHHRFPACRFRAEEAFYRRRCRR